MAQCEAGCKCDLADLFERADRAMYAEKAAKNKDKNKNQRQAADKSG